MVCRFAWIAMWLTFSNMFTRKSSLASCRASKAVDWKRYCVWNIWTTTSFTRRWNGNFLISSSVHFWYFLICLRATVPGLNRLGLRICPRGLMRRLRGGRMPLPIDLKGCALLRTMVLCPREFGLWRRKVLHVQIIKLWLWNYRIMIMDFWNWDSRIIDYKF